MHAGLIHRAIIQSGVNMNSWAQPAFPTVAHDRTIIFAHNVDCNKYIYHKQWVPTMNCLRKVSAETLTIASKVLYVSIILYKMHLIRVNFIKYKLISLVNFCKKSNNTESFISAINKYEIKKDRKF